MWARPRLRVWGCRQDRAGNIRRPAPRGTYMRLIGLPRPIIGTNVHFVT